MMRTDTHPRESGPLAGTKVVEMGSFIAGPFCGQILADLGAEVIKIEPPGAGDTMRQWGLRDSHGQSLWWSVIGRNKLCMTLDLRQPEGREIARRLILDADVLVENFRPGTIEKWGLGPDALRQEKPGLIVTRVSGYGQTGPYGTRAGFGGVAEAMAGLRHLTGYPDRVPTRVGISIGDSIAGLFATIGILAALVSKPALGGRGQVIDVAIVESVMAVLEGVLAEYSATGKARGRSGPILPGIAPSNLYPVADDVLVMIAANADTLFARLATAMGQPALAADPRYATHAARGRHQEELDACIADWTVTKTRAELLALMDEHGIPAGPVNDAAAVCADPHFRAREAVIDVPVGSSGTVTMQGVFPKFSETPTAVRWAGPALGAHTVQILSERLGFSAERIAGLEAKGIV